MTITVTELVLAFPATYRLTRLVTTDHVTERWRERVWATHDESEGVGYLIGCDWCTSPYVAALVIGFALLVPESWSVPLLAIPALSGVAGVVASHTD